MDRENLKRIAVEFCDSLYEDILLYNIKHFPEDWDGRHVRGIASISLDPKHQPNPVKRTIKEVEGYTMFCFRY